MTEGGFCDFARFLKATQESGGPPLNENEVIYFVLPSDKTEVTCSTDLSYAFQICQERSVPCKWMKNDVCMQYEPKPRNMFVLDPFFTPLYDKLVKHDLYQRKEIEIMGPQCLRYDLEGIQGFSIKSKSCPPFNLAMKNVVVTFTGFSRSEKEKQEQLELTRIVELMNGKVIKSYIAAVTHVVAKDVISDKCMAAHKYEVPIMQPEWIRAVWNKSKTELVTAEDPYFRTFVCPPFYDMNVCLSQMPQSKKVKYKQLVERYGGVCTSELLRQKTKILVVPEPIGEKFTSARKWNIPCVAPEWIERSVDCGYAISPQRFSINRDGPLTSTPKKAVENSFNDISVTTISAATSKGDWRKDSLATNSIVPYDMEDKIKSLQIGQDTPPFLDGCTVFLCGRVDKSMMIRKLLNISGAVRIDRLNEGVTHVLVLSDCLLDSEIQAIKSLSVRPAVVSLEWLIASAELGHPANVKKYNFDISKKRPSLCYKSKSENLRSKSNSSIPCQVVGGYSHSQNDSATMQERDTVDNKRKSNSSDNITQAKSNEELTSDFKVPDCIDNESEVFESSENKRTDRSPRAYDLSEKSSGIQYMEESLTGSQQLHGIFYKQVIKICLEDEKDAEIMKSLVIENDGTISTKKHYSIIVLPPVYSMDLKLNYSGSTWTKYRIIDCAAKKSFTVPEELYHIPYRQFKDMDKILSGCVLAFSQYNCKHKEYFTVLATSLGAVVQNIFAKKDCKERGYRKTTHLICSVSKNEKFLMAEKWGVNVAVAEWLTECFKRKELVEIKPFNPLIFAYPTPNVSFAKDTEQTSLHEMEVLRNDDKSCSLSTETSYEQVSVCPKQNNNNEVGTGNEAAFLTKETRNLKKKIDDCRNGKKVDYDEIAVLNNTSLFTESHEDSLDISHSTREDSNLSDHSNFASMSTSSVNESFDPNKSYSFSICQSYSSSFMAECERDVIKDYLFDNGFVPLPASPLFNFVIPKPGTPEAVKARRAFEKIIDMKEKECKKKDTISAPNKANPVITAEDFTAGRIIQKEHAQPLVRHEPSSVQTEVLCKPDIDGNRNCKLKQSHTEKILSCSTLLNKQENTMKRKSESPLPSPVLKKRAAEEDVDLDARRGMKCDCDHDDQCVDQAVDAAKSIKDAVVHVHETNKQIKELENTVMQLGGILGEFKDPNVTFVVVPDCAVDKLELPKPSAKVISSDWLHQCRDKLALVNQSLHVVTDPVAEPEEPRNKTLNSKTLLEAPIDGKEEIMEELDYPKKSKASHREFSDVMTKEMSTKIVCGDQDRNSKKITSTDDILQKVADGEDEESQQLRPSQDLARLGLPKVAWAEPETIKHEAFNHPILEKTTGTLQGGGKRGTSSKNVPPRVTRSSTLKTQAQGAQSKMLDVERTATPKNDDLPENPLFLFSGLEAKEKDEAVKALTPLGARFSEKWTPLCTGLILKSLTRSEKVMNCIASCKCVLKWSYVEACVNANRLVNVTDYLWDAKDVDTIISKKLATASRTRYFQKRNNPEFLCLQGWKFFFCDDLKERRTYKNLIECGGAQVVDDILASNCVLTLSRKDNIPSHIRQETPVFLADLIELKESSSS